MLTQVAPNKEILTACLFTGNLSSAESIARLFSPDYPTTRHLVLDCDGILTIQFFAKGKIVRSLSIKENSYALFNRNWENGDYTFHSVVDNLKDYTTISED